MLEVKMGTEGYSEGSDDNNRDMDNDEDSNNVCTIKNFFILLNLNNYKNSFINTIFDINIYSNIYIYRFRLVRQLINFFFNI